MTDDKNNNSNKNNLTTTTATAATIEAETTTSTTTKLDKPCSCCSPLGNVAYNKSTVQTADRWGNTSDSHRTVDGEIWWPHCVDISSGTEAWWRVDLGQLYRMYNLTLIHIRLCELISHTAWDLLGETTVP